MCMCVFSVLPSLSGGIHVCVSSDVSAVLLSEVHVYTCRRQPLIVALKKCCHLDEFTLQSKCAFPTLYPTQKESFCQATVADGSVGLVPISAMLDRPGVMLHPMPWFHGPITRYTVCIMHVQGIMSHALFGGLQWYGQISQELRLIEVCVCTAVL